MSCLFVCLHNFSQLFEVARRTCWCAANQSDVGEESLCSNDWPWISLLHCGIQHAFHMIALSGLICLPQLLALRTKLWSEILRWLLPYVYLTDANFRQLPLEKKWTAAIDISCVKVTFIAPSKLPYCFSVDRHSYGISFPIVGPWTQPLVVVRSWLYLG